KNYYVSRAVMLAFVGERPEGYHICHIDGNIKNNRLDNLRYDSPTENNIDQFRHDNGRKNHSTPLETVIEIRKYYKNHKDITYQEIANIFDV
ncbi:HNH endonuclease signature motif containing protein, partial [Staphylococcus capitis]|uniref:HNH endonuclease signature motif containing protein n=1 Tax=Staphylococcus capitis TaxID=29388 RepID=UPI000A4A752F